MAVLMLDVLLRGNFGAQLQSFRDAYANHSVGKLRFPGVGHTSPLLRIVVRFEQSGGRALLSIISSIHFSNLFIIPLRMNRKWKC